MKVLQTFIDVVEKEAFVEAHEVLEEQWKLWKNDPMKRDESYILKGLINGATALALIKLGREESARRVWETYEKYRPLIHTVTSIYTPFYFQAQTLLETKHKEKLS